MSLASVHVNKMSLGVINLKTGCCTKTWVSVTLSTLVSALLSSSFLGTNFTFFLRSLLFSSWENHFRKMLTWKPIRSIWCHGVSWRCCKQGRNTIQLEFQKWLSSPWLFIQDVSIQWTFLHEVECYFFGPFHAFPHTAVGAKQLIIAVYTPIYLL